MEKTNLIIGIVGGVLLIAGALFGLYLAPLKQQMESLEKTVNAKFAEVEEQLKTINERHRRHTGDTSKHVNEEWRTTQTEWRQSQTRLWDNLEKRLDRIENVLLKLLGSDK